jgi:hypothetical protein
MRALLAAALSLTAMEAQTPAFEAASIEVLSIDRDDPTEN